MNILNIINRHDIVNRVTIEPFKYEKPYKCTLEMIPCNIIIFYF